MGGQGIMSISNISGSPVATPNYGQPVGANLGVSTADMGFGQTPINPDLNKLNQQVPSTWEAYQAQQGPVMTMDVKPWQQGEYVGMDNKTAYETWASKENANPSVSYIGNPQPAPTGGLTSSLQKEGFNIPQGTVWDEAKGWVTPDQATNAMPSPSNDLLAATGQQSYIGNPVPNQNLQSAQNAFQSQYGTNPFVQAAQANAMGNIQGAQAATAANRVNQSTPFGNLTYTQTGTDASGNPIWSANQTLTPELARIGTNLLNQLQSTTSQPFDVSQYQQGTVNAGPSFINATPAELQQKFNQNPSLQTSLENQGMAGWDRATGLLMERLEPSLARQQKSLDTQLANQGIMRGSEAYNQAQQDLAQKQNDLRTQAALSGQQVQQNLFGQGLQAGQFGNTAQQQMYQNALSNVNQQNTAAQQNFQNQLAATQFNNQLGQQSYANQLAQQAANNAALQANYGQNLAAYQLPMSQLGAFKSASAPTYINPYTQAAVSGPDILGAYTSSEAARIAQQNADAAKQAALTGGLFQLGSSALSNPSTIANIGSGLGSIYNTVKGLF